MEVLQRTANRGSIATGGYDIANSLKLESDNAEYLYYTPSTQTDYERMAFSLWIKRTELGTAMLAEFGNGVSNTSNLRIGFDSSDRLFCYGNSIIWRQTNQVFRDTSAWYHLFFLFDTTTPGGISNNRIRIWVNGSMIAHTDFGVIGNPSSGAAMGFNNALQQSIGAQREDGPKNYFNGYMAQVYGSGGTPPVVTDFGEFDEDTGIWKPIDISALTPPDTQGFNLDFSDANNLGNDISSRNNNFTLQNITSADQATDTPTNNFCIMNMLNRTNGNIKNQEGGTKVTTDGGSGWCSMLATMGVTKGKWYWESQRMSTGTPNDVITGIVGSEDAYIPYSAATNYYIGNVATSSSIGYYQKNYPSQEGSVLNGVSLNFFSAPGDTIMFGLDMDNNKMYFGLNGTWLATNGTDSIGGNPARASTLHADFDGEFVLPGVSVFQGNNMTINFGGYAAYTISSAESDANGYGTFEYAPPTGYYALCTKNLAEFG